MDILKSASSPFDPVALASSLRDVICKDSAMKYASFYRSGPHGGVSTGYVSGCNLRCIFCWVDVSRDEPDSYGRFYSPEQAYEELMRNANVKGVKRLRLSGGEPTICQSHLFKLLEMVQNADAILTLETNGILLGADESYVKNLAEYKQFHVRLSLKAGSSEGFQRMTGAQGYFFELPYSAIKYLMKYGLSFHVSAMTDPKIVPSDEKTALLNQLKEVGYNDFLEEETCQPQPHAIRRLKDAGLSVFAEEWIA